MDSVGHPGVCLAVDSDPQLNSVVVAAATGVAAVAAVEAPT